MWRVHAERIQEVFTRKKGGFDWAKVYGAAFDEGRFDTVGLEKSHVGDCIICRRQPRGGRVFEVCWSVRITS